MILVESGSLFTLWWSVATSHFLILTEEREILIE